VDLLFDLVITRGFVVWFSYYTWICCSILGYYTWIFACSSYYTGICWL